MIKFFKFFIVLTIFFGFIKCANTDHLINHLTINGYGDNFSGYAIVDGYKLKSFEGIFQSNASEVNYYYEKNLNNFRTVKVFVLKHSEKCSLTMSIWVNGDEVATLTSDAFENYDPNSKKYVLTVGPLYYTRQSIISTGNNNDNDDVNDDDNNEINNDNTSNIDKNI